MNVICTFKLPMGGVCGHVYFVRDAAELKRTQSLCPACRARRARIGHQARVRKYGYARIPRGISKNK